MAFSFFALLRRWRHALQDYNRRTAPARPVRIWKDLKHFLDIERLEDRNSIADAVGPVLTTSALSLTGQLMQMIVSERIDLPLSMPVPRTHEPPSHGTDTGTLAIAPRDTTPAANHLDIDSPVLARSPDRSGTPAAALGGGATISSLAAKASSAGPTATGGGSSVPLLAGPLAGSGGGSGGGGSGPLVSGSLTVDVVDQNNGLVLSPNVPVNDF